MSIQNEILTAIASRRSCRAYKPEQLTAEELEAVTTAGTWAATAMGRQSPVMVAVQDKETLAELSRLNAAVMGTQNDPFYGAPTAVLVLGDTNSCLAAISAKRLHIPLFHMEAGNRCKDECLPEETNRRIVDVISDVNMCYSEFARKYLADTGLPKERTYQTGSPMAEVLHMNLEKIQKSDVL